MTRFIKSISFCSSWKDSEGIESTRQMYLYQFRNKGWRGTVRSWSYIFYVFLNSIQSPGKIHRLSVLLPPCKHQLSLWRLATFYNFPLLKLCGLPCFLSLRNYYWFIYQPPTQLQQDLFKCWLKSVISLVCALYCFGLSRILTGICFWYLCPSVRRSCYLRSLWVGGVKGRP